MINDETLKQYIFTKDITTCSCSSWLEGIAGTHLKTIHRLCFKRACSVWKSRSPAPSSGQRDISIPIKPKANPRRLCKLLYHSVSPSSIVSVFPKCVINRVLRFYRQAKRGPRLVARFKSVAIPSLNNNAALWQKGSKTQ